MKTVAVHRLLVGLALAAATGSSAGESPVTDSSYRAPDDSRVLEQSVVIEAGIEEVWAAFTTADGLESWAVPSAWVEFGVGGYWETSYDPDAVRGHEDNIRSRILAYQPLRMIAIQAEHAPPGFSHPELLDSLFSVFTFDSVDEGVRITAAGVGYADGEGYDALFEFFRRGNAWTLTQLEQRFESGPVSWDDKLEQLPAAESGTPGDGLAPLSFLAGDCWIGTFGDGETTDTHCYTWIYGGRFLRDVHVVERQREPYCGETIYHVDPEDGIIRYTYYNSLGGVSRGRMEQTDDGLFSPAEEYEGPDGSAILLRSWLAPADDLDGYRVTTERDSDGEWLEATKMTFGKAPELRPESALDDACGGTGETG